MLFFVIGERASGRYELRVNEMGKMFFVSRMTAEVLQARLQKKMGKRSSHGTATVALRLLQFTSLAACQVFINEHNRKITSEKVSNS